MPTEDFYNREAENIDEFNREEAKKRKAEIDYRLHAANAEKASPCINKASLGCGIRIFAGGDGDTIGVCGEKEMFCMGCTIKKRSAAVHNASLEDLQ